jgi:hypothetical protein
MRGTVFEAPDRCILLMVAEHTRTANTYQLLYDALGIGLPGGAIAPAAGSAGPVTGDSRTSSVRSTRVHRTATRECSHCVELPPYAAGQLPKAEAFHRHTLKLPVWHREEDIPLADAYAAAFAKVTTHHHDLTGWHA